MKHILFLLLSLSLLTRCGREMKTEAAFETMQSPPSSPVVKFASAPVVERKLIKNGNLYFETEDIEAARKSLDDFCKMHGAYISSEQKNNLPARLEHNVEVRVPAEKFETFLKAVESLADNIDSRNIYTRDVTEEYIDVEARLTTKKELEQRYLSLLKQAKTVEEMLAIENQLAIVRAEIESAQGKLNYLTNQVSFSTLAITYYQKTGTDFGFASKFVSGLKDGWDNLLMFIIGVAHIWPFVLILAVVFWIVRKGVIRKFRKPVVD